MENETERGLRKMRVGKIVSEKMNKTIVVSVDRAYSHPLYKKTIRRSKHYYAHDETNDCRLGDTVRIVECRPLSKLKRWRVTEVLNRAK